MPKSRTEVQIISQDGKPIFVVLPYGDYLALKAQRLVADVPLPQEVVALCIQHGLSLLAAWRTIKGLSQVELALRIGISQPAVAQMEKGGVKLQKRTRMKAAAALELRPEQLVE